MKDRRMEERAAADSSVRIATVSRQVTSSDTATSWGDAFPPAASTPFVLGIAEVACHQAIAPDLAPGEITVGVAAHIEHLQPSAVGATLVASAVLVRRSGRRLSFEVEVREDGRLVATVAHERAAVDRQRILDRLA
jgi:fluoroacetyl-CoA thioesterase